MIAFVDNIFLNKDYNSARLGRVPELYTALLKINTIPAECSAPDIDTARPKAAVFLLIVPSLEY